MACRCPHAGRDSPNTDNPMELDMCIAISAVDLFQSARGPRAKRARQWFAENGPPDLQPLPLGYAEREAIKRGGPKHILAWYARSLADQKYDFLAHPSFHDYARGVMASDLTPDFIKNNEELRRRFPPRSLHGLGPGLEWFRPKKYAEVMASVRRMSLPPKEYAKEIAALRRSRGVAA